MPNPPHLISVAPMMNCTDRHARYLMRLISPDVRLYTEMITAQALRHGATHLLKFHPAEKPVALQLGGHDPRCLVTAARMGEEAGFDEINLNVGCPSERVRLGQFGACLMLNPNGVALSVAAMRAAVAIPVTVKCRIGVDDHDSYEALHHFISHVMSAGCQTFIIHARKALLRFSPKQNRDIPPLRYDVVKQVKKDFPQLTIVINGGFKTIADIDLHLPEVDGMMIGRMAYSNPYFLAEIQARYFSNQSVLTRYEVVQAYLPYVVDQLNHQIKLATLTKPLLGLFQGQRGASAWRRYLSEHAYLAGAGCGVIEAALAAMASSTPPNSTPHPFDIRSHASRRSFSPSSNP